MKCVKTIILLLAMLLSVGSMCAIAGCKGKKVEAVKAEPNETSVKKLYLPFADETVEESTGIIHESDDYLLEEPLEYSDEEAEDDPNIYPEEEPNDEPDEVPEDPNEEPNDYPGLEPNDYPWDEPDYNWL